MPHAPADAAPPWRLVMPVRGGPGAKSRLAEVTRRAPGLAEAIALDSVEAALACPVVRSVHVVCADVGRGERLAALGAVVVRESRPGSGLLPALAEGFAALDGDDAGPVAVLLADVPSLRPADLLAALAEAEAVVARGAQATVPDAEGTGTVLLAGRLPGSPGGLSAPGTSSGPGAPDTAVLRPRFGPGSALAHRRDGARPVGLDLRRLRRDVDTAAELEQARALGIGPRTAGVLAGVVAAPPHACA